MTIDFLKLCEKEVTVLFRQSLVVDTQSCKYMTVCQCRNGPRPTQVQHTASTSVGNFQHPAMAVNEGVVRPPTRRWKAPFRARSFGPTGLEASTRVSSSKPRQVANPTPGRGAVAESLRQTAGCGAELARRCRGWWGWALLEDEEKQQPRQSKNTSRLLPSSRQVH